PARVQLDDAGKPLRRLLGQLRRIEDARVLAQPEYPGHDRARFAVLGLEYHALAVWRRLARARLPKVAHHVPIHLAGDPHARRAHAVPQLPGAAGGVDARVEVLGRREVVLGFGRVADLASDARESEHPHGVPLVRIADEVVLAVLEQQVVR